MRYHQFEDVDWQPPFILDYMAFHPIESLDRKKVHKFQGTKALMKSGGRVMSLKLSGLV